MWEKYILVRLTFHYLLILVFLSKIACTMSNIELKKKFLPKKEVKKFNPLKFLGLVKWGEDAVKYQRRLRDGK